MYTPEAVKYHVSRHNRQKIDHFNVLRWLFINRSSYFIELSS